MELARRPPWSYSGDEVFVPFACNEEVQIGNEWSLLYSMIFTPLRLLLLSNFKGLRQNGSFPN